MEWFIGFLGAVLGTAAGGLSVFLTTTTRAQMRRELEHTYDQELRTRRVESYMSLYKRTDKLPRYWPAKQPVRREMQGWVRAPGVQIPSVPPSSCRLGDVHGPPVVSAPWRRRGPPRSLPFIAVRRR